MANDRSNRTEARARAGGGWTAAWLAGLLAAGAFAMVLPLESSAGDARSESAAAGKRGQRLVLRLRGGEQRRIELCGARRRARVSARGGRVVAVVRTAKKRGAGGGGRPARPGQRGKLTLERCRGGRFTSFRTLRLGRGSPRYSRRVPTGAPGQFRIRARVAGDRRRGGARSRFSYLRVSEAASARSVVDLPVAFRVRNQNRSRVPCDTDGKPYTLRGRLVGPRSALAGRDARAVTLYVHNIGTGRWYWNFKAVRGYDYATELARLGHVSLVYDQLGYGESGRPVGTESCYGGEADIASQMVGQVRAGTYTAGGRRAPRFKRVALASHSIMSLATQPEAYSFKDVDALIVQSWASGNHSPRFGQDLASSEAACTSSSERAEGDSGPPGYAFTPPDPQRFRETFVDADPRVVRAATELRGRTLCGEAQSGLTANASDQAFLREVKVPVLLVYGARDPYFQPGPGEAQAPFYSGTRDLTVAYVPNGGHMLALERSAPAFRRTMSRWLEARGF